MYLFEKKKSQTESQLPYSNDISNPDIRFVTHEWYTKKENKNEYFSINDYLLSLSCASGISFQIRSVA